jgi:transposase
LFVVHGIVFVCFGWVIALPLMYLKVSYRHNPQINNIAAYFRIVESYRNEVDRVCHRTLLNIGFWPEASDVQLQKVIRLLNDRYHNARSIFEEQDPQVLVWVEDFWNRMITKKTIDRDYIAQPQHYIKANSIKHKEAREIGTEWLCANTWHKLQLSYLLTELGWTEQQIQLAMTQVISRAVYPASELETARWIKENSAICDITGYDIDNITKDKLYQSALDLYKNKDLIEKHLSTKTNELFDLQDRIIIYDLTNTYFEGSMHSSKIAKYGRSKEKRNDAKLVVLAMVVNTEGFIKYSSIHEGNYSDSADISTLIDKLSLATGTTKPIVVMDSGIATENNLALLDKAGHQYMVVSRKKLKDYETVTKGKEVYLSTKTKKIIRLTAVTHSDYTDHFLKVESPDKARKEQGMSNRFTQGYEKQLSTIKASLTKPSGIKKAKKVYQRIGRAKEKYPSVHHLYQISLTIDEPTQTVTAMQWHQDAEKVAQASEKWGTYFLRTNMQAQAEALEWMIYNTIREIESTFRVLKTDLDLRPIYHKKDQSSMAHLHLGMLAYWLVNTIRHQLKLSGINDCWQEIRRKASTQKSVITTGQNKHDHIIQIKRCTEPTAALQQIQQALQYDSKSYKQLKFVVHKPPPKKNETQSSSLFNSA